MIRPTLLLLALLLAPVVSLAQIPRTITYQGRVVTASGPLTGIHTMQLAIYDAAGGGTPLFSESQQVDFGDNGLFTVAIGAGTPGGIDEGITFEGPTWLGVTIEGFNGGSEITPRYVLRSVPYSFRAEHATNAAYADQAGSADSARAAYIADRAIVADSAVAFSRVIGGDPRRTSIGYVDIADTAKGSGVGLRVAGDRYAIIAEGVDSTRRYFVAAEEVSSLGTPNKGSLYRDNTPMAWCVVESVGTIVSDFGIASVVQQPDSSYEVTLDHAAKGALRGTTVLVPDIAPVITIGGGSTPLVFPTWTYKRSGTGYDLRTFIVRFVDVQGATRPAPFSMQVFGRVQ